MGSLLAIAVGALASRGIFFLPFFAVFGFGGFAGRRRARSGSRVLWLLLGVLTTGLVWYALTHL